MGGKKGTEAHGPSVSVPLVRVKSYNPTELQRRLRNMVERGPAKKIINKKIRVPPAGRKRMDIVVANVIIAGPLVRVLALCGHPASPSHGNPESLVTNEGLLPKFTVIFLPA